VSTYKQDSAFLRASTDPVPTRDVNDRSSMRGARGVVNGGWLRGAHRDDQLAATFDRAAIGIAEVDREGRVLRANKYTADMVGYTPEELLGRSMFDPELTDDGLHDAAEFRRQVAGEIDSYTMEKRFKRKDGVGSWASVTSSSVRDRDGNFLYAVRIQQDISNRKRAEEQLARRIEQQAALYQLTEQLQGADSFEAVYDSAMTAILRALNCQRTAILLCDDTGFMRFVAWRGLSDGYRAAVEGHSPWPLDSIDPPPLCLADVAQSELADDLKVTVRQEGIGAVAFVPLCDGGRLIGKFMAYYDSPHVFSSDEIEVALAIARHLSFGVEQVRTERAAPQLASIVESSDDAIVSKNLDGIITSWNNGAQRLFGYTAAEAIGQPVTMLIPEDRIDEEPGILGRIRAGERIHHYETVRRRKDGSMVDIELTVSPMRDRVGRIVGASKIARNITERKRAEAKLRDSERQLQELLTAIPAAIYTTDAEGRVTYYNQAAVELAGREPQLGTDEWCVTWKLFRPDGTPLPHEECPMAVALKEGRPIRNAEAVAERPDGTRVPFIPYPTPLRDGDGNIVGAINMLVDISERKQAETQQRILLNELNHRVKNNMQMLSSLLFSAVRRTTNPEALHVLNDATSRIAAMTAAQRVLYGTFDATRFNAEAFVNAVCQTVQPTLPRNVEIRCEASDVDLPNDLAMPLALILNELLTNAAKHGLDGRDACVVRAGLRENGDGMMLSVEDDGPGFDLEQVRQRASGLRLVQGLARQLRGRFEVTAQPSTRCVVHFPRAG
jgi:PAS domain S-box-containing protein